MKIVERNWVTPAMDEDEGVFEKLFQDFTPGMHKLRNGSTGEILLEQPERFFMRSRFLDGYTPGDRSVHDEIMLATHRDYLRGTDGRGFSALEIEFFRGENDIALAFKTDSPLIFEQQVNNLRRLYEHLGDNAINYTAEFETALQGIIDEFVSKGGMYIQSDREGVADSIRAMFRGEEGKYTAQDLKTMAALAFEDDLRRFNNRLENPHSSTFGTFVASQMNMIGAAFESGKLSEAAFETVVSKLTSTVDFITGRLNHLFNLMRNDPNSSREFDYSPLDRDNIMDSINEVFNSMREGRFDRNLSSAMLGIFINLHNATLMLRFAYAEPNEDNNRQFINRDREDDIIRFENMISSGSQHFADFLNGTELAVNNKPLFVDVTV
jgi:hypothetical protein